MQPLPLRHPERATRPELLAGRRPTRAQNAWTPKPEPDPRAGCRAQKNCEGTNLPAPNPPPPRPHDLRKAQGPGGSGRQSARRIRKPQQPRGLGLRPWPWPIAGRFARRAGSLPKSPQKKPPRQAQIVTPPETRTPQKLQPRQQTGATQRQPSKRSGPEARSTKATGRTKHRGQRASGHRPSAALPIGRTTNCAGTAGLETTEPPKTAPPKTEPPKTGHVLPECGLPRLDWPRLEPCPCHRPPQQREHRGIPQPRRLLQPDRGSRDHLRQRPESRGRFGQRGRRGRPLSLVLTKPASAAEALRRVLAGHPDRQDPIQRLGWRGRVATPNHLSAQPGLAWQNSPGTSP